MKNAFQSIAGWANYPSIMAKVFEPENHADAQRLILEHPQILARGNGKSYGDASLAPTVLSTRRLNKILAFDAENGIVDCESGVLLSEILKIVVPKGWFFKVTPGIKEITVGGAIASDVHGKNHPSAGCFSEALISFDLMTEAGEIKTCSKTENATLFWKTCGGMGWTGIILSARFSLLKIGTTKMLQKAVKAENLKSLFQAFDENPSWPYAAGWIDCTSKHWRGVVLFAAHEEAIKTNAALDFAEAPKRNVPFYAPSWFLNRWSIWMHNYFYFRKKRSEAELVSLDQYFYPLDALQNWNRFYGRRGLVQYQFCLPQEKAADGIQKVLEAIQKSGEVPFLTVLKRHGARRAEAVHSFPIRGFSLALDFPRTKGIFKLVKQLDEIVWQADGKIYLTKDACSAPKMGRVDPSSFGSAKFSSLLKERIAL